MKSVLRFTLLSLFAAGGFGLAVSLATRAQPGEDAPLRPPWTAMVAEDGERAGTSAPAESPFATSIAKSLVERDVEEDEEPASADPRSVPPSPPTPPSLPKSPPPQESAYQLVMAQQMGRMEEKLRRAEEIAERQQRSLETMLTTFQQPLRPAAAASLQQPAEEASPDLAPELPPLRPAQATSEPAGAAPLPAPPETSDTRILPEEGDGRLTLNLRNSDLRQVLDLLSEQHGLNIIASPAVQGAVTARLTNVDAEAALDAVLKATGFVARREGNVIYVATPEEFQSINHAHDRLGARVYRPNYITAAELQKLLTPIITPGIGVISVSTPAEVGIPADNVQAGGDSFGGAEVILVQDYESVLNRIDELLLEVDARPLQVAIEAMIITVALDDSTRFGVNFAFLQDNAVLGSGAPVTDLAQAALDGGLKFAYLDSDVAAFLEALETVGDANVVAAPRVMVLNKQRAEIHIGDSLGYLSTTITETAATQAVEFLEVGTQLRIRPFISSDGMIRLEVHPELSTGDVVLQGGASLPQKSVTQVTTNVMCRDGATVVLGGLIREDLSSNSTQIPVLGGLPLIGAAFRQKTEERRRTETIVLLTPRIVSSTTAAIEGDQHKTEYLRRQDVRYDKMNPFAQRYYGMQYLRKAQAAWNAGDADVALRYANLAIHFNPESLEAINLRTEIVETAGVGDRSVETHLREGLAPWGHPHREYSRHGAPWQAPEPAIIVGGPPEPGSPGKIRELKPVYPPHGEPNLLHFEEVYPLDEVPEVVIPTPGNQPPGR